MSKFFRLIKVVLLRGYSPLYYCYKFYQMIRNNLFINKPRNLLYNDLTFFNKEGYMTLNSKHKKINKIIEMCEFLAKKHIIDYEKTGKNFVNFVAKDEQLFKNKLIEDYVNDNYFRNIAEKYLKCKPVLANAYLMLSFPTDDKQNHSQLWHLDADDTKICTFYLHCSNVDDNSGPFRLIPKTNQRKRFLPKYLRKYGYNDDEFFKLNPKKFMVSFYGKKTEFVCDTANVYHCGSLCKNKPRLILGFRYISDAPLYPITKWAKAYNFKYI